MHHSEDVIAVATIQQLISWTRDNTGSRLEIFWDDIVAAQIFPHEISTILHRVKLRYVTMSPKLNSKTQCVFQRPTALAFAGLCSGC